MKDIYKIYCKVDKPVEDIKLELIQQMINHINENHEEIPLNFGQIGYFGADILEDVMTTNIISDRRLYTLIEKEKTYDQILNGEFTMDEIQQQINITKFNNDMRKHFR